MGGWVRAGAAGLGGVNGAPAVGLSGSAPDAAGVHCAGAESGKELEGAGRGAKGPIGLLYLLLYRV